MLFRRSMPDCCAVTRAIAWGGNRLPTNSSCWGLRARMTPSRSATVSTLPARKGDPVCLSRARCSDRRSRSRPATSTPRRARDQGRERQCEWQKAGADAGRCRKSAGGEPGGGHRIAYPLRLIAGWGLRVSAPRCRRSCRPHRAARQTRTSAGSVGSRSAVRCTPGATSRTSSNCATALNSVRAPSAMLPTSPFSSCACCSARSPSCARRSAQWLYSTHTPSSMTGSRQVRTMNSNRTAASEQAHIVAPQPHVSCRA